MTTEAIMNRTRTDAETLSAIFNEEAERYNVRAETSVVETDELKINWMRHGDVIVLSVSDYVTGVPPEAARDLARTLMNRLYGGLASRMAWMDSTSLAFSSDEFAEGWQDTYIERHGFSKGLATKGKEFVKEMSKHEEIPKGIAFMYTDKQEMHVSVSARVVALPKYMKNASKEAVWFAFDVGVRKIAGGICNCRGEFDVPMVFVNLTAEDKDMLVRAGAWKV